MVHCLLAHDEDDLAERVRSLSDEELMQIGQRAEHYVFAEEQSVGGGTMGTSRAVALAAVDVLEKGPRALRRDRGRRRVPAVEEEALRRLGVGA